MNVLIVDDVPKNRKLLRAQLEAEGLFAFEAGDGVEALAELKRNQIDAAISDILMPRMDGYRFCYEVRRSAQFRNLPLIIYTATYTSPSDEKLSLDMGADKYLRKPASAGQILDALHEAAKKTTHRVSETPVVEADLLKEYSERLVAKLEQKTIALAAKLEKREALTGKIKHKIVQHKSSQGKLEPLPNRNELILKSAGEGIYGLDLNGNIIFENPKAATLLGWTVEELLGKPAHATIHHKQPRASQREEAFN